MVTVLVTGASGKLGKLVLESLLKQAASHKIIATTRNPEKLADSASKGVEIRRADFTDEPSLLEAFKGVDRLFLISVDSPVPGVRSAAETTAIRAAAQVGVKHIVYSSVVSASEDSPLLIAREYAKTEKELAKFSGTHTIVSSNWWFNSVFDANVAPAVKMGKLLDASGDGHANFNTREDHAEVLARVLAAETVPSGRIQVHGADALRLRDVIALVNELAGLNIAVEAVTPEQKVAALESVGLPNLIAELVVGFDRLIAAGKFAGDAHEAAQWLGRQPHTVREFLQARVEQLKTVAAAAAGKPQA